MIPAPLRAVAMRTLERSWVDSYGLSCWHTRMPREDVGSQAVSILAVRLVPDGLIFGADCNVTSRWVLEDGGVLITASGQSERPKVLNWPNREVIVGYVGAARIEHRATDEWLYRFIGGRLDFDDLASVAGTLTDPLRTVRPSGTRRCGVATGSWRVR
jgi:hypothetical protein